MKVKARYAKGVLTPLEPLKLEEGVVVELNIELTKSQGKGHSPKFRVVPVSGGFTLGVDPNNLKQFLNDEDDERYLRSLNNAT